MHFFQFYIFCNETFVSVYSEEMVTFLEDRLTRIILPCWLFLNRYALIAHRRIVVWIGILALYYMVSCIVRITGMSIAVIGVLMRLEGKTADVKTSQINVCKEQYLLKNISSCDWAGPHIDRYWVQQYTFSGNIILLAAFSQSICEPSKWILKGIMLLDILCDYKWSQYYRQQFNIIYYRLLTNKSFHHFCFHIRGECVV